MESKMKHAVSLIVLVVTILVLAILAAAVIISLSNTNIMSQASQTVFKSDMANFKEAYEMYVISELADDYNFDRSTLNVTYESKPNEFKKIFGENVSEKYKAGLKIVKGKLVYETENESEQAVLEDLGMIQVALVTYTEGVPIPAGFYYVGGTKTTGLVISDEQADKGKGVDATLVGNQFVWVPVDNFEAFKRGYAELETTTDDGYEIYKMTDYNIGDYYTEPLNYNGVTASSEETAEYTAMCASVKEYDGFYVARYEAGDGDATAKNKERTTITEAHTVVSKKGATVYNHVPWGYDMATTEPTSGEYYFYDESTGSNGWNNTDILVAGAVYLSRNMYKNSESVVSTLCYGVQWDAIMNFVSDKDHNIWYSASWGNYTDYWADDADEDAVKLYACGSNEDWKAKNIYDLAGNAEEWTMEADDSDGRVFRGGDYDVLGGAASVARVSKFDLPASDRDSYYPNGAFEWCGFRPTLYIVVE